MAHRPDDVELVRNPRLHRKQFANFHPLHIRPNGVENPPVFRRCLRLHIIRLHVGRTARQPDEDDRGIPGPRSPPSHRLTPQHIRQTHPQHRQPAKLKETPAGHRSGAEVGEISDGHGGGNDQALKQPNDAVRGHHCENKAPLKSESARETIPCLRLDPISLRSNTSQRGVQPSVRHSQRIVRRPMAAMKGNGIRRAPGKLLLRQPGNIRQPRRQRGIGGEVVMRFPGFRKDTPADFEACGGGIFVTNPFCTPPTFFLPLLLLPED